MTSHALPTSPPDRSQEGQSVSGEQVPLLNASGNRPEKKKWYRPRPLW